MKAIQTKAGVFTMALAVVSQLTAQPVITNSIVPQVGNSSTFRLFDPAVESPGPGGAAVTWDFSNVTMTGTSILQYNPPSSYANASQFPGSTLVAEQSSGILLFLKEESQYLSEMGLVASTLTETYIADPRVVMKFPMTYGDSLTDNFEGTAILSAVTATRTGSSEIVADGYGTLILPYGTFTDVLRVRLVSTYADEFLSQVVNTGVDTIYNWYMEGHYDYLYTWSRIESSNFGSIYYGAYLDTLYAGSRESAGKRSDLVIYPNPAAGQIRIVCGGHIGELSVYDQEGRLIYREIPATVAKPKEMDVDLSHLQKGLYYLVLKSGGGYYREKLVLTH